MMMAIKGNRPIQSHFCIPYHPISSWPGHSAVNALNEAEWIVSVRRVVCHLLTSVTIKWEIEMAQ